MAVTVAVLVVVVRVARECVENTVRECGCGQRFVLERLKVLQKGNRVVFDIRCTVCILGHDWTNILVAPRIYFRYKFKERGHARFFGTPLAVS